MKFLIQSNNLFIGVLDPAAPNSDITVVRISIIFAIRIPDISVYLYVDNNR